MKFMYLGTAAAEGFPAVFCNCSYCKEARRLGGKNIRTRSQSMINEDMLIDFPADTYHHFLTNNIEGDKIKYLLVTHSHRDHFYCEDLKARHGAYAHDMRTETLQVYCGKGTHQIMLSNGEVPAGVELHLLEEFQETSVGSYKVTPLPARHYKGDGALFYLIKGDKTVLYAHDTGYFYEEVFDYLKEQQIVPDMISFDCTYGDIPASDESSHMGLDNIFRVVDKLRENGNVDQHTILVINHFSHNANPLHEVLEEKVREKGYLVAYDGMRLEI